MTTKQVLQVFDTYQKARLHFAQMIADLAMKQSHTELLIKSNVLELLVPLFSDICPQVQQCAAVALGRLVYNDLKFARQVLREDILATLLKDINQQNKYMKKSILFVLRGLSKHDEDSATIVVNCGGLNAMVLCLEDFEIMVKESAVWGIGYLARHSLELAMAVVGSGAIPHLVLCMQEPELSLKQITASAIADIAKHCIDAAQAIVDAGAVPYLAKNLNNQDEKLKRQILGALASIAYHTNDLAEMVVEARIFPTVLIHLAHPCAIVRRNAAALVRDIVKHSVELSQLVANNGGVNALLEVLACKPEVVGEAAIPAITALGYIAGQSDQIALSVFGCNGIVTLNNILRGYESNDATQAAVAWTIGQIGKHSPEHSKAIASANIFPRLLELHLSEKSSADLKIKTRNALKQCLQKCLMLSALEPLIYDAPSTILKYVLGQFSKVLPNDPKARRLFVSTGGLKKLQEIDAEPGTTLMEYISIINACFPEEIVRFYSPNYPDSILEQVEQYTPQALNIFRDTKTSNVQLQTDSGMLHQPHISEELMETLR